MSSNEAWWPLKKPMGRTLDGTSIGILRCKGRIRCRFTAILNFQRGAWLPGDSAPVQREQTKAKKKLAGSHAPISEIACSLLAVCCMGTSQLSRESWPAGNKELLRTMPPGFPPSWALCGLAFAMVVSAASGGLQSPSLTAARGCRPNGMDTSAERVEFSAPTPLRLKGGQKLQREEDQEEGAVLEKQGRKVTRERAEKGHGNRKKRKLMKIAEPIPLDEQVDVANRGKKEETIMRREKKMSRKGGIKRGHGQESDESEDSEVCINA